MGCDLGWRDEGMEVCRCVSRTGNGALRYADTSEDWVHSLLQIFINPRTYNNRCDRMIEAELLEELKAIREDL